MTPADGFRNLDSTQLKEAHVEFLQLLSKNNFTEMQARFDASLQNQAKYYRNFMKMYENLMLFVRGTRQSDWNLHLASVSVFVKYFFAYDLQNYARLSPVYLAQMFELEEKDRRTWNFFKQGNFSVNKTNILFSAIGADHAIEHENRSLKVLGGIKGIANNQAALDQYFLIAPEVNIVLDSIIFKTYIINQR